MFAVWGRPACIIYVAVFETMATKSIVEFFRVVQSDMLLPFSATKGKESKKKNEYKLLSDILSLPVHVVATKCKRGKYTILIGVNFYDSGLKNSCLLLDESTTEEVMKTKTDQLFLRLLDFSERVSLAQWWCML